MINSEQIRAARGLLDWSTKDLAKLANMTVNGINKIERGHVNAHRETLETIERIFEEAGIEFLPGSGLRKKDRIIQILEGEDSYQELLDDVYNTLKDTGGEVLIAYVDERKGMEVSSEEFLKMHLERLAKANITERLLIRENDRHFLAPLISYHGIPEEYFSPHQFYIYGSKLAHLARLRPPKAIIIDDERFAGSIRQMFNLVWDKTTPAMKAAL